MSVLQQTVSLAAQLRAFSSLLSLPSQAQSVIKAFRRQGIGYADEFKFTFELEGEPDNAADLKLIIMASAPQSNGVTRAYGKAVQIAQPLEAVCEEYDIKEDFDNKHGAPNAAAPKIFMKYFFVNTKTGEKSGEMLTMVRLDEDAPADGE